MQCIQADAIPSSPWRNGGGRTRELFTWPPGPDWQLRISLADIDTDGPFSAFPGVQRFFAVLEGAGVSLDFSDHTQQLTAGDAPIAFDGALTPDCRLIRGATRDLNLMLRGLTGAMQRVDQPLSPHWSWRAVFCTGPAVLHGLGAAPLRLAPRALLLGVPPGPLRVERLSAEPAFWIGAERPLSA